MATINLTCAVCGSTFESSRSDAVYCSAACRQKAARGREASMAQARIGGITVPVSAFKCEGGAFGAIGHAELTVPGHALRSVEFQRSPTGSLPIELRLGDALLWGGDVTRVVRDIGAGMVRVQAEDYNGRLARMSIPGGYGQHCNAFDLAGQIASSTALRYEMPESLPNPATLALLAARDGAAAQAVSGLELLLWAARDLGMTFTVRPDGELIFRSGATEARMIEARNLRVTSYERDAPVAAIVRSTPPLGVRQPSVTDMLRNATLSSVPPGVGAYVFNLFGRRQVELDPLACRLRDEITRGVLSVEGETDAPLVPHDMVRVEGVDVPLLVARVTRRFADGELSASFEGFYLPPPPRVPSQVGAADAVRVTWPQMGLAA